MKHKSYLYIGAYLTVVPLSNIKSTMPKKLYKEFSKWFNGQTGILIGNEACAYTWDIERFLKWKLDKRFKPIFD